MEKIKKLLDLIKKHKKISGGIAGGILIIIIAVVVIVTGNKKDIPQKETTFLTTTENTTKETESETEEATTEENHDNDAISKLTGDWVNKKIANKRPVAIMINNISDAIPQAGISKAQVIYEAPVEGGMTRLMALFDNYKNIKRIGSIRSCRLYYCGLSNEFDAIYVHFGQSKYAKDYLDSDQIDNVSGLSAIGNTTFYRATDKFSPHDVYTDNKKLEKAIKTLGYRRKYKKSFKGKFKFADVDGDEITLDDGEAANKVTIGYPINAPYFKYDKNTGLYKRFQYGQKHIDENNKEQIAVKNIIVQYVSYGLYDDNKSLDMTLTGTGEGYYITNGKCIKITWKKRNDNALTKYYDENGDQITLNVGKTWVCIAGESHTVTCEGKSKKKNK